MTFGEKLKTVRESKHLSQAALGKRMNVTQQTIAQYEKAIEQPKMTTVKRLSNALGVALSELVIDWSMFSKEDYEKDLEFTDYGGGFYGKEAPKEKQNKIKERLFGTSVEMSRKMDLLNDAGQKKAIEQVELLTKIPEYQRKPNDSPKE